MKVQFGDGARLGGQATRQSDAQARLPADLWLVLPVAYVPRRAPSRHWEVRCLAPLRGAVPV